MHGMCQVATIVNHPISNFCLYVQVMCHSCCGHLLLASGFPLTHEHGHTYNMLKRSALIMSWKANLLQLLFCAVAMQTCCMWCPAGQSSSPSAATPEGSTEQLAIWQEGQIQAGTCGRGWGDEGGSQCWGPSGVGQSWLQASQESKGVLQCHSSANVMDNYIVQHSISNSGSDLANNNI